MEFKLNKIDPELRRQVNAVAKEGKVHGADHGLEVNKDKNNEKQKENNLKKLIVNKKILINAEKAQSFQVDAFSEDENKGATYVKGRFLDIRK